MDSKNIRVAVIEPVGGHGGMNYYDFGLCCGLAEAGVDVVLHTCDETIEPIDKAYEVRQTFSAIYGDVPAWKRGLRYLCGTLNALISSVLEGRRICHFHVFHVGPLQVINIVLAKSFRRRVVITAHDVESFVDSLEIPAMSRWIYRLADRVVAHNLISRKELIERIGINATRIIVIPHGNYIRFINPIPAIDEARRALKIDLGTKVILFFGQIKDVKGLDLLLEAMPKVLEKQPNTILLIAGKPWKTDFSKYKAIIDRLGISDHCITHIRYIPDKELPYYYASADLVVLPYRRIYQSGVVLMAMSYAIPVLVSDLEGMIEIVTDGKTGYVFHQGSVDSLTIKLNEALSNKIGIQRMAQQGYNKIKKDYDWISIGEKVKEIYENIL